VQGFPAKDEPAAVVGRKIFHCQIFHHILL